MVAVVAWKRVALKSLKRGDQVLLLPDEGSIFDLFFFWRRKLFRCNRLTIYQKVLSRKADAIRRHHDCAIRLWFPTFIDKNN